MTHAHHEHPLNASRGTSRRLFLAMIITLLFVVGEAVAGFLSNSLVLLTDAAHNVTDVMALALSLYALRLTARPANSTKTFGYHRVGILVALVNSASLIIISLFIFYEAYQRIIDPQPVMSDLLILVAAAAFIVNAGTAWMVSRGSEGDLNLRSTFLHLAADAISTFAAILAGVIIKLTGWNLIDPLISVLIGGLIVWNGVGIVRESLWILMESTPSNLNVNSLVEDLKTISGVRGVHDLHVWSITRNMRALSAHVLVEDMPISATAGIQVNMKQVLLEKYHISHATMQLECPGCSDPVLFCDLNTETHRHD